MWLGGRKGTILDPGETAAVATAVEGGKVAHGGSFRSWHQPFQGEEGEEDAEDLDWEADDHVRVQVAWKPVVTVAVPPTNISHTYPIERSAQNGYENVYQGEFGREGDDGFLVLVFISPLLAFVFVFIFCRIVTLHSA